VTQIVEKEVIKYVDRPSAPVTHTHTHEGVHGFGSGTNFGVAESVTLPGTFAADRLLSDFEGVNMADCPAGTTQQADGTCLEGFGSGFSQGFAVPETIVTPSSGGEYCYGNGGKRYDSLGKEIKHGGTDCNH